MTGWYARLGLAWRVQLCVLPFAAAAMFAVWSVVARHAERTVEDEGLKQLAQMASHVASETDFRLHSLVAGARIVAANDLVVNGLVNRYESEASVYTFFQSLQMPAAPGARVTLADYRGRAIASNQPDDAPGYENAEWLGKVLGGEEVLLIGTDGLVLAVPVFYSGLAEALVIVEYGPEKLAQLFGAAVAAEAVLVTDGAGTIVFSSNDGLAHVGDPDPGPRVAGWKQVRATPPDIGILTVVAAVRTQTILAPVDRVGRYMLAAIVLSLLALVIGISVATHLATKPLALFIESIRGIGAAGDLRRRVPLQGGREMLNLGKAFNQTLAELEATTTSRDTVDNILNSMGEMLLVTDSQGTIRVANRAALATLGYAQDELIGLPISKIFPAAGSPVSSGSSPVAELYEQSLETVCRIKSGNFIPVLMSSAPMSGGPREVPGIIFVARDIAELMDRERALTTLAEELKNSNADLESFATVASHDLREPLRKVQAFGDRLKSHCAAALDEKALDYIERMRSAAARMEVLIDDLLTVSRVSTRGNPFVPVDLAEVARRVVEDLDVRLQETGGIVGIGPMPVIEADDTQMHLLFQNLIGNALKYRRDGVAPKIRISAEVVKDTRRTNGIRATPAAVSDLCRLRVVDNGIGFENRYADRIFGIFQRLHGRDAYDGTGVGLAICRRIAERHGGHIVAAGRPGRGATITVILPMDHGDKERPLSRAAVGDFLPRANDRGADGAPS